MGDMADYCLGSFYLDDFEYDPDYYTHRKKKLRCKHCGSTDVYWHQYPTGKWFLFNNGKPHVCKSKEASCT